MSLDHELVVFRKFIMFIKFISVWPIRNTIFRQIPKHPLTTETRRHGEPLWQWTCARPKILPREVHEVHWGNNILDSANGLGISLAEGEDWLQPYDSEMQLTHCPFSNKQLNEAAKILKKWEGYDRATRYEAFLKLASFRATYQYPLRVVTTILRQRALAVDPSASVYGRPKRMVSVIAKLLRNPTMALTTMQDIGGCRAVLSSMEHVTELASQFREIVPRLESPSEDDYIADPKSDGYRSIHFVVRYSSRHPEHSRIPSRRIEIQIRSQLQHQWATAVETVDLFTDQKLKVGGGHPRWKRFFLLASSLFALKEGYPLAPGTPTTSDEIVKECLPLWRQLRVPEILTSWTDVMKEYLPIEHGANAMYLVEVDVEEKTTYVKAFSSEQINEAYSEYANQEFVNATLPSRSVVLVSAINVDGLREGFPSYYGDTQLFIKEMRELLQA